MTVKEEFKRTAALIGAKGVAALSEKRVAVFGLGGVGSYAVEALARAGIGALSLFDGDVVAKSNVNRQLYALQNTIGAAKCEVAKARVLAINPDCRVDSHRVFFNEETKDQADFSRYDYIIDAVDTVSAKLLLALSAQRFGKPIISCMGAGNKLDPTRFKVADVFKTDVCPLAKAMRRQLRANGVPRLKCVYSDEPPARAGPGSRTPASCSFVPPVAGFILAAEAIKDLLE